MLEHCGGRGGFAWYGLVGSLLLVASVVFLMLIGYKSKPRGAVTPVLGGAWIALGIVISVMLYSALLPIKVATAQDKIELENKIEDLKHANDFGGRAREIEQLTVRRDSAVHELCIKSYEERVIVLFIPIVLSISAGFGCALFTAWLTAGRDNLYQQGEHYIGFTNSGVVYSLEYQGIQWWHGKDIWLHEEIDPPNVRSRLKSIKSQLLTSIVLIKTKAELELEQTLAASSVLNPSSDLRQRVRSAVS